MTDALPESDSEASVKSELSAGTLLRQARQAKGMHIAALAAAIKLPQRKLEALEADRYHELPDNTFTRALAKALCRCLNIDSVPVLAQLPPASDPSLEHVFHGLNTPFRDRPGRQAPTGASVFARPAVWAPIALVLGALLVYKLPQFRVSGANPAASAAVNAPVVAAPIAASSAPTLSLVVAGTAASEVVAHANVGSDLLRVRASAQSWVEVRDAADTALLQRMLQPGEVVGLNGKAPFRVIVGNAASTYISFRGQAIDLIPLARSNVARLDLQ